MKAESISRPNGLAEILAAYGDPQVRVNAKGAWKVDPQWERANLETIRHPLLPRGKLYVHRRVGPQMMRLLDRWQVRISAGDPYRVRTLGCFAPRAQRGATLAPSTHTWAIAWDLNADRNQLISPCEPDDPRRSKKDIPDAWIADAELEGFFWGGHFRRRFDPMHFQACTGY
jgi:hypothetical protein